MSSVIGYLRKLSLFGAMGSVMVLSACSGLLYYPTSNLYVPPDSLQLEHSEEYFETADGVRLHAWLFEHSAQDLVAPKSFIVYFHGNAQNLTSHYLNLRWMPEQGHSYWIFDYRGYGLSDDVSPSPEGTYRDGLAALERAYEHYLESGAEKFIVYTQSLGGAVAMRAIEDFEHADELDLIVLDSTFRSYSGIARRKMRDMIITWPLSFFAPLMFSDKFAAKKFLDENTVPTLVIHSRKDPVVPFQMGEQIYQGLKAENKWFWELDEREHGDVFYSYDLKYRKKFLELIDSL